MQATSPPAALHRSHHQSHQQSHHQYHHRHTASPPLRAKRDHSAEAGSGVSLPRRRLLAAELHPIDSTAKRALLPLSPALLSPPTAALLPRRAQKGVSATSSADAPATARLSHRKRPRDRSWTHRGQRIQTRRVPLGRTAAADREDARRIHAHRHVAQRDMSHRQTAGRVQLRDSTHLELRSVLPATESAARSGAVHVALAAAERVLRRLFKRRREGRK